MKSIITYTSYDGKITSECGDYGYRQVRQSVCDSKFQYFGRDNRTSV